MARFAFRASTAAALALVMTIVIAQSRAARAQEAEPPSRGGFFDRVFGGSERLSTGERAAAASSYDHRTAQVPSSDLLLRLDRLEAQIRQLTGIVEQLQHRNHQLETYIRRTHEDSDAGRGPSRPAAPPRAQVASPQSSPPAPTAGRRGDAFDPSQHPSAAGAPHPIGSPMSASQPPPVANYPDAAGGAVPGQPQRHSGVANAYPSTLPPTPLPKDEFDLAYGYILRKDYALAEEGFRQFIGKHPNDRLTGDATYWLAESFFQRQQYRDAAENFLNVSTKYESATKAPDALLRLGQSLAALGEKEAACASLGEVMRKFPRASASVKQGVEREQKRVRC